jgi:hypothetical protein
MFTGMESKMNRKAFYRLVSESKGDENNILLCDLQQ